MAKKNRFVLREMRTIYYGPDIKSLSPHKDFMGYDIDEFNAPTYHHIKKEAELKAEHESAKATVENGAYLGEYSHRALHSLEEISPELYEKWNQLFLKIVKLKNLQEESIVEETIELQKESTKILELYHKNKKR